MDINDQYKILGYRFSIRDFALLFLLFFFMEGIFSWLFLPNSLVTEGYIKLAGLGIYAFMLFRFPSLKTGERVVMVLFTLVMIRLVLESLLKYDSVFKQLTMFTVLFPVVYVIFISYLLRRLQIDLLGFMAKFYVLSYIAFMVLFGRGFSFSLAAVDMDDYGPFSGDSRIIHASHILMLVIPFLYYLHRYISERKIKFLGIVIFCTAAIILHQHRSVWSATLFALAFYTMASIRNRAAEPVKYLGLAIQIIAILLVTYFFVSNLAPGFTDFLSERFAEIFDPAKEGSTGNFRIEQRVVYSAMVAERPIFGWTFEGFEMPNPLVDWWPEMTGQHFHEGYMEMLFYHGIVGLLLKYGVLFYFLYKIFSKQLGYQSIILISFGISGLLFSFNYVLPLIFWGFAGMALYYIRKDSEAPAVSQGVWSTPEPRRRPSVKKIIKSRSYQS
ncbi:MAG: O-antigen ligase domain-containing protein [Chitinophagaceae bacterium]|nr:MAG: O-antigen ligase domain-containing protein [Chitinophagaceae bacterium]